MSPMTSRAPYNLIFAEVLTFLLLTKRMSSKRVITVVGKKESSEYPNFSD